MSEELRIRDGRSLSLAQALEERLAEWSERTGIAVEIWARPGQDAPPKIAKAVLAVLEEALANIERHSRARVVSVAVTIGRGGLRMTVSDNGVGFLGVAQGRGVTAMQSRFAELGGSLSVSGVPGEGTTVTGVVPRRR
ncbi:signal transduction histidine kinase [Streptosporangium becharense]|uniref:Signal transduction histidine kinase n=1 Tax=Streptosporangium becharense TaxID=1816182 RepID=A0A7W9MFI5_9ACTN|nr:ATP-binding protein [Streptosporangium becharense]MBB2911969.1 signal transduction histidine kinase [Streptosporangium becharense]MBB5818516.1 signal transduction histidine kinase [Streptosporangium becharense]